MPKVMTNVYTYTYTGNLTAGTTYQFNIKVDATGTNFPPSSPHTEWTASSKGVSASSVVVNGVALDYSYIVTGTNNGDANFAFFLDPTNTSRLLADPNLIHSLIARAVPPEVDPSGRASYVQYANIYTDPGTGIVYDRPAAWMEAIYDTSQTGTAQIDVDYLRTYALRADGTACIVQSTEYSTPIPAGQFFDGLLAQRYPWWLSEGAPAIGDLTGTNTNVSGGYLHVLIGDAPNDPTNLVYHWYLGHNPPDRAPANSVRIWHDASFKITGPGLVQVASDTNSVNSDVLEMGTSDWYSKSGGFQYVSVNKPLGQSTPTANCP